MIAAANPIGGRYDPSFDFAENVELTDPILQRFDILCVLQDIVDPIVDERLASFVVGSHIRSHPDKALFTGNNQETTEENAVTDRGLEEKEGLNEEEGELGFKTHLDLGSFQDDGPQPLDQAMLRKYIAYARGNIKPVLHDLDTEKVRNMLFYSQCVRKYSYI